MTSIHLSFPKNMFKAVMIYINMWKLSSFFSSDHPEKFYFNLIHKLNVSRLKYKILNYVD